MRLTLGVMKVNLLLVLLFLAPMAGKVPYSVLAGILLVTSYGMLDRWSAHLVWKLTGTSEQKKEIAKNLAIVVSVTAVTVIPAGATVTESPCDIHTDCSAGCPANKVDAVSTIRAGVWPYSPVPVAATVPPNACAIAWNP